MTLTQITEKGIKDGEIVNADINASAAIAGSKIDPSFTSNITVSGTDPRIIFTDTNNNPDFTLHANGGEMQVENSGSGTQVKLESSGSTRVFGNLVANADLTVDTNTLHVDSTNNRVGIGTTSPTRRFSVKSAGANATQISLIDNDSSNEVFQVGQQADGDGFVSVKQDDGTATISLDASGTSYFNGGNVGIGLTAAARKLHQHESSSNANYHQFTNDTTGSNGGDGSVVGLDANENLILWNQEDTILRFATDNQERMQITNDGQLLIGSTTVNGEATLGIKGSTTAWGGAGNSTANVGAKLVLEDEAGRRVSLWAPKNADGAVGSITNHHFYVVTGNASHSLFNHTTRDLEIIDGNLKLASGHGIDFSATSNSAGSMSSEILDDYEEGTFTPILRANNNTTGQVTGVGRYTKVGNIVHCNIDFENVDASGIPDATTTQVTGLPYNVLHVSDNATATTLMTYRVYNANRTNPTFYASGGTNSLFSIYSVSGGAWSHWPTNDINQTTVYLNFSISYFTST